MGETPKYSNGSDNTRAELTLALRQEDYPFWSQDNLEAIKRSEIDKSYSLIKVHSAGHISLGSGFHFALSAYEHSH
jgi:hypothetical protein